MTDPAPAAQQPPQPPPSGTHPALPSEPPHWFSEQRREALLWIIQVLLGVVGFILVSQYTEIKGDLKELREAVNEIRLAQERQAGAQAKDRVQDDIDDLRRDLRALERTVWGAHPSGTGGGVGIAPPARHDQPR